MTYGGRRRCIFVVVLTTTARCCLPFTQKFALVTTVPSICDRIAAIPVPSFVVSVGATGKNLGEDLLTDDSSSLSSSTFPTTTSTPEKRISMPMPMPVTVTVWGGEHSEDARIAARLVSDAVTLCLEYQHHLTNKSDTDGNCTTNNTTLDKTDGTPVTALDFAIQGYIISSLKKHEENRHQNNIRNNSNSNSNNNNTVSFLAEEDANDLRNDENHKGLSQSALNLARSLDPNLTMEDFLDALDDDRSRGGKNPTHTHTHTHHHHHQQPHRSWILDPIDGTRGLLQGKQYAIGLALCLDGRVVMGVLGNPSVATPSHDSSFSPVMVAVKGHGLRYYDRKSGGNVKQEDAFLDPPRKIPGSWHTQDYDLESLVDASYSSPLPSKYPKEVGVHYPPYLLSMGPKTTTDDSSRLPKQQPPFPFGPLCPPTELCCGSLVKYYAIASGQAAGFLQLSPKVSGYVNSWDHAPGMLCVEESGGSVVVVTEDKEDADGGNDGAAASIGETSFSQPLPLFDRPQFPIHHGIVCVSREASGSMKKRLFESVLEN